MPFLNQHAARMQDPDLFDSDTYRTTAGGKIFGGRLEVPSTINILWGKFKGKSKPSDPPILQSFRFNVKDWTEVQARKWLKDNNIKFILFEKATGPKEESELAAQVVTMTDTDITVPVATEEEKAFFEKEGICLLNQETEDSELATQTFEKGVSNMPAVSLETIKDLTPEEIVKLFNKGRRTPKITKPGADFFSLAGYYPKGKTKGYYPSYPPPRYEEPNIVFCVSCGHISKYTEDYAKVCPDCETPLLMGFAVGDDGSAYYPVKSKYLQTKPDYYPEGRSPFYKVKKTSEDDGEEDIFILPLEYHEGEVEGDLQEFALETVDKVDIPIFEVGIHNGDTYTKSDLAELAQNFNTLAKQVQPPFKLGHIDQKKILPQGMPAIGWVYALKQEEDKLLASIKQIPKRVAELIDAGAYQRISPEIYVPYKDVKGNVYNKVLAAVTLLGADIPAVKTLPAIEKLYKENSEKNPTIKVYGGVEDMALSPEELQKLKDQMAALETQVAESKTKLEEADTKAKEADIKLAEADKALKTKDEALRATAEARKKEEIKLFLENGKTDGKILPVFEVPLQALLESAVSGTLIKFSEADSAGKVSEKEYTQIDLIKEMVTRFPKMVEFEETTGSENTEVVVTKMSEDQAKKKYKVKEEDNEVLTGLETHELAEKIAAEKKIEYADALVLAYAEQKKE